MRIGGGRFSARKAAPGRYGTIRWEEQLTIMKYLKPIIKSKFLAYND